MSPEGDLYDYLQRLFGLGEWDEFCSTEPWWEARNHEVSKIKRSLKAKRIAVDDVRMAADYAHRHRKPIKAVTWLYQYIYPALHEKRDADPTGFEDEYAEAVLAAADAGSPMYERLLLAIGPGRREVLEEWRARV